MTSSAVTLPKAVPKLVLLDRDGVINFDRPDSVRSPAELILIPGSAQAIAALNQAKIPVALATNQSIVGRGIIDVAMLERIHRALADQLALCRARIDRVYVAPDAPEQATKRRKPGPGMLLEALRDFQIEADDAVFVGDTVTDAEAAKAAGIPFILVRSGKGSSSERSLDPRLRQAVFDDLAEAVGFMLEPQA